MTDKKFGYYKIMGPDITSVVYVHDILENAVRLCTIIDDKATLESFENIRNYDEDANTWQLGVENNRTPYGSNEFNLYSTDKGSLVKLGFNISSKMPSNRIQLCKWARIRLIFLNGVIFKQFRELPYTNVKSEDWI